MDVAAAGRLIIFFSLMVAQILVGGLILAYAGYSFLHVLISTAAGNDAVAWPGDPFFDWLFKGWYLIWIAALSVMPGFLIITASGIPPHDAGWGIALASSACFLFPVFLLSSLSGSSRIHILRGQILAGIGRRFGLTLLFYVFTALILVSCAAFAWYALFKADIWVVPFAMVSLALGLFLYARLLGRLGQAITEEPASKKSAKSSRSRAASAEDSFNPWGVPPIPLPHAEETRARPAVKKKRAKKPSSNAIDPWAIPETEPEVKPRPSRGVPEDPLGPAEGSYDLQPRKKKGSPVPQEGKSRPNIDESDTFRVSDADLPAMASPKPAPALAEVSSYEAALAAPRQRPEMPANPMMNGVFSFPFYPTSLGPLGTIALGLCAMGLIARAQIAVFPS